LGLWGLDQVALGRPSASMPADGVGTLTRDAAILLLVFTVALPLLRKLEGGLERLMFRRRHGVRDALVKLIKELGSLLEITALARTLTEGLVTRVPVLSAGLYRYDAAASRFTRLARATSDSADAPATSPVLDKALALWLGMTGRTLIVEETSFRGGAYTKMRAVVAQLEAERVALVVPLFMEGEVTAVLVVGEKLSGEIFDTDEIELLEMLAGETVIALKNAGLYQGRRSRPAHAGLPQSDHERDGRDGDGRTRRAPDGHSPGRRRAHDGQRERFRHGPRDPARAPSAHLRALLHDEERGAWHRARAVGQ